MSVSLGRCGARDGDTFCPGDVVVDRVVGGIEEGSCPVCGLEYAAPVRHERVQEPENDFIDEKGPWWKRD